MRTTRFFKKVLRNLTEIKIRTRYIFFSNSILNKVDYLLGFFITTQSCMHAEHQMTRQVKTRFIVEAGLFQWCKSVNWLPMILYFIFTFKRFRNHYHFYRLIQQLNTTCCLDISPKPATQTVVC